MSAPAKAKEGRELDRFSIESAIMDVRGDRLLLTLAIDAIETAATSSRDLRSREHDSDETTLTVHLLEDELDALAHAHMRLLCSIRELEKVFYGEPKP